VTTAPVSVRRSAHPSVRTWAILLLAPGPAPADDAGAGRAERREALAALVDGVVTVPAPQDTEHRGTTPGRPGSLALDGVATGLPSVPEDVELVVLLDEWVLDTLGIEPIRAMLEAMDRLDAARDVILRATPVTDALKRVEDGEIVGGVERAGLHLPQPPYVVRREALATALAGPAARTAPDAATLLLDAGLLVRVLRDDGATFTVGAGR